MTMMADDRDARIAQLEAENAALRRREITLTSERDEARAQQARFRIRAAVDLDLRFLPAGKIQIADIIGNEQHLLDNRCYIQQTHLFGFAPSKEILKKAGKRLELYGSTAENFSAFIFLR